METLTSSDNNLPCENLNPLDPSSMSHPNSSSPIHHDQLPESTENTQIKDTKISENNNTNTNSNSNHNNNNSTAFTRRERPSRACTVRTAARLHAAAVASAAPEPRKPRQLKKERFERFEKPPSPEPRTPPPEKQCSKIITPLVAEPPPSQLPRWTLRSMWELASILNFLHIFRPLLNIQVEFSAEEFETALIIPNSTLDDIHIPLLKAIPPITRMALGRATWVTVLCRKLRDWWHWVAEGELPIVAAQGAEVEAYKELDPGVRVVILKALCDIRVEVSLLLRWLKLFTFRLSVGQLIFVSPFSNHMKQEDIRNYIDNSLKHGVQLSTFRKERIGGYSHGISYEADEIIGHRLYREIRKVEVKVEGRKGKAKGSHVLSNTTYQWETVATNLDEFQDVSEKLFSSKNRTEASLGKKLKIDMLPEIEKVHKKKERLLKKQHRQALLLDSFVGVDGLVPGRSLRDRKPVTYTFDDFDRSINEAIKITKKQPSPEPASRQEIAAKTLVSTNGRCSGPSQASQSNSFDAPSPTSHDYDEIEDQIPEMLDRSNRRRQRPQRYSARDFVEAVSDNEADFDSDSEIEGEAVYDDEYLRTRKQKKRLSSSSEGDEEYRWDEDNAEDEEEEEEEEEDSLSMSEESDEPQRYKKLPGRTRGETKLKLRSVDELQSGLRRSNRATRNRVNYRQYDMSDSDTESAKPDKSNASNGHSDASENVDYSPESQESEDNDDDQEMEVDLPVEDQPQTEAKEEGRPPEKPKETGQEEVEGVRKRRFLDLNELASVSGFDEGPNTVMKDEDTDNI
ncbi:DDT domain [Dillenia turbinata]|uniref:DDT domain n=1 Tax=Dillenia turbinata TaxID=194707 RepID=A0AAN8Z3C0_9MAGN